MCTKEEVREVLEEREWFVPKAKCSLRTNEINIKVALMQKDIKNVIKGQNNIINKLDNMEKTFANKWVEKWVVAVTILFALSALYLMFDRVNLPH